MKIKSDRVLRESPFDIFLVREFSLSFLLRSLSFSLIIKLSNELNIRGDVKHGKREKCKRHEFGRIKKRDA